jgi:hypothetical protein
VSVLSFAAVREAEEQSALDVLVDAFTADPVIRESPNPRNIHERHGFEVTGASQAGACPPVYSMLRPPR